MQHEIPTSPPLATLATGLPSSSVLIPFKKAPGVRFNIHTCAFVAIRVRQGSFLHMLVARTSSTGGNIVGALCIAAYSLSADYSNRNTGVGTDATCAAIDSSRT